MAGHLMNSLAFFILHDHQEAITEIQLMGLLVFLLTHHFHFPASLLFQ